jgi:hypothetical protein
MSDSSSRDDNRSILPLRTTNQTEKMENPEKNEPVASDFAAVSYPSTQKRILIMVALYLAMFLVTLVREPPLFPVALITLQIGLLICLN